MLKNALDQIFAAPWTAIIPGFMIFFNRVEYQPISVSENVF